MLFENWCAKSYQLIKSPYTKSYRDEMLRFNLVQVRYDDVRLHKLIISAHLKDILLRFRKTNEYFTQILQYNIQTLSYNNNDFLFFSTCTHPSS